ncbi:hypothetical protein O181_042196 [Austropuccinia psidii MF-1]|uniref:Uncharacterized protein n=1 Tax=Austropuccinia psidii MF-1 TaxID=1389203 RepID=A0A9Q3HEX3_9BASI|nr:hypothetical protein [Austropuccinia psidii MF-1]
MDKIFKTLQGRHAQLSKPSEETNKRLNLVFEEQHHSKRRSNCLHQDINKLLNVYHNLKPQPQGQVMDNPNHQEDIRPDALVEFKDKSKERVEEVTKKKTSCHNCGSTYYYANNCPKAKKKVYAIEKVPEEESPTQDSESDSMRDAIREQSDEEKDPRAEFLVEYQEETPLEIQDIQLEAGMPQDTSNKNLCKHTQDA